MVISCAWIQVYIFTGNVVLNKHNYGGELLAHGIMKIRSFSSTNTLKTIEFATNQEIPRTSCTVPCNCCVYSILNCNMKCKYSNTFNKSCSVLQIIKTETKNTQISSTHYEVL